MACNEENPLKLEGTSQYQRQLNALDPSSTPLDELGLGDWLSFAYYYAANINYYNISNTNYPQGDWRPFFEDPNDIADFIGEAEEKMRNARTASPDMAIEADIEPHLALFISFILLLGHSKRSLNGFTERHLDFYYKQVLQLKNRKEVPDKVHVIYQLAKNISSAPLSEDTLLDAGKDTSAKPLPLYYKTNSELIVNTAKIAALKSLYNSGNKIRYANAAFSVDGLGLPFKEEAPKWNAFGNQDWPVANTGFSVASKILLLKEGTRTIRLTMHFRTPLNLPDPGRLREVFNVFLTGESGWIKAEFPESDAFKYTTGETNQLSITVILQPTSKPVVTYNKELHGENYLTDLPVMRLIVQAQEEGFSVYQQLHTAELAKIGIDVDVKGMKDLGLENDLGRLDASKPFLAFGSQPRAGSNLYIGNAEIFQKDWKSIKANIDWKNKPDDLPGHYNAYRRNYIHNSLSRNSYDLTVANESDTNIGGGREINGEDDFTAEITYLKDGRWYPETENEKKISLFKNTFTLSREGVSQPATSSAQSSYMIDRVVNYYAETLTKGTNSSRSGAVRSNSNNDSAYVLNYTNTEDRSVRYSRDYEYVNLAPTIRSDVQTRSANFSAAAKNDFIRITLTRDFLHSVFPRLYAVAMTIQGGVIPKEPYTPEIAGLTIDYTAYTENEISDLGNSTVPNIARLNNYTQRKIQFFHETAFGQAEQHIFLKDQFQPLSKKIMTMAAAPALADLYIGLQDAPVDSVLSLLFQVAEGSENPVAPAITETLHPEWYFLSGNEWLPLDHKQIISDDTNYFLRSGIVRLLLPPAATDSNTFLNQGLRWLRISLPAGLSIDSVSKFINVHAQAGQAIFSDQDNNGFQLESGLPPGTISKLVNRIPQIKTVSQPYASFGGQPKETDAAFRQRISERLRHKHRAVMIWDYERLVLARFPYIYKVRCLNHTNDTLETAPGSVRIIVIPDIRNQNSFDPFEPRVSANKLREIKDYLVRLNSLHIDLQVENPNYEKIRFDLKVAFYPGLDKNEYTSRLNTDLIRYLSPWAFDQQAEIPLGGSVDKSKAIQFMEELPYVDYITDFRMYFDGNVADPDVLQASNSRSILVSVKNHEISTSIQVCTP